MSIKWRNRIVDAAQRNPKTTWGFLLGSGALLYLKAWLPATHVGIPCPFRLVTGLQCPGCGMTRAASSLLSLDAPQAFAYNPLPFVLAPLFLAYLFAKKRKANRTGNAIMAVMLAMTIAFGVLRNLPGWESWAS